MKETAERCPNPIFQSFFVKNSGRSIATNSQNMRPKGANILGNETKYNFLLLKLPHGHIIKQEYTGRCV